MLWSYILLPQLPSIIFAFISSSDKFIFPIANLGIRLIAVAIGLDRLYIPIYAYIAICLASYTAN